MAIKIIKHGQKEFTHTCSRCGCEFTYEFEDILTGTNSLDLAATSTSVKYIKCPDCGYTCYINNSTPYAPKIGWPTPGEPIPCNVPSEVLNPCADCDWWKKMTQSGGFTYVGDTPCTWCNKNRFYCGTDTAITVSKTSVDHCDGLLANKIEYTAYDLDNFKSSDSYVYDTNTSINKRSNSN